MFFVRLKALTKKHGKVRLMQFVMLVIQILIAVALIGIILVQRTSQDGGGLMGGGSTMGGLFTARGSANLLTRVTAILATLFIVNSLALGILASRSHQSNSLIDQLSKNQMAPAVPDAPKAPDVPQVPMAK
jgi:preprotein translocase subunit SecG